MAACGTVTGKRNRKNTWNSVQWDHKRAQVRPSERKAWTCRVRSERLALLEDSSTRPCGHTSGEGSATIHM